MKNIPLILLLALVACGQRASSSQKRTELKQTGAVSLIMTGVEDVPALKLAAKAQGVAVEGEQILFLKGDADAINSLNIQAGKDFRYQLDESVQIQKPMSSKNDQLGFYQAKKDFGLPEFWKTSPEADGRGVVVGVLDDGISPHQQGFLTTSTGARKFLVKGSQSTFTIFDLKEVEGGYEAEVNESRPSFVGSLDLNFDGEINTWIIKVNKALDQACIDQDCKGSFSKTGEFFLSKDSRYSLMVEIDQELKKIKIFQPEAGDDSHGEGVASVLAGYKIGNVSGFDGVAPGAQILDYDMSEVTNRPDEVDFNLSTILKGLDWLGAHGAEVVNLSYSVNFTSVETQTFMREAIDHLIKKYNMVISFSAGNNGPGLGSLNRRSVYPDSSLVAGAFISKELDERVAGVTGIPEEGRVVYYSSRGPGQGVGPTLISPLTSLTNSSPDSGHMAFNGTSSASPALAGAAAVLVSAIKQQGLKVDAPSVVHALRLSGQRLKAEPFISQGYGLPKVEAALSIYKKIIKGEIFQNVHVDVSKSALDGVAGQGALLRTSQSGAIETRKIWIQGSVSKLADTQTRSNLLTPVRLEYSPGITGPAELWVSSGESVFSVDISIKEALGENVNEAFGEIKILSQADDSLMAVVPVTFVNDLNLLYRPKATIKVGAEEGRRFHINVPEGVKGFKVKAEVLEGDQADLKISVFDTNQVRIKDTKMTSDLWVWVDRPGWHQVTISMNGGTPRGAVVKLDLEAFDLKIKTTSTSSGNTKVTLSNSSKSSVQGLLLATKVYEVIKSQVISSEFKENLQYTQKLAKGSYQVRLRAMEKYDLSFDSPACTVITEKADGTKSYSDSKDFELEAEATVTVRCLPFDYGMEASSTVNWVMHLSKVSDPVKGRVDMAPNSKKDIYLDGVTTGKYNLQLQDPISKDYFDLGELDVY